jgi:acyl-CoA dehydrogenase
MDDLMTDALRRLLEAQCPPRVVRAIERGESTSELWLQVEQSGFADALVDERRGGAGLALRDAFSLMELCGSHVLPMPLGQTMLARALLVEGGAEPIGGTVAIATQATQAAGLVRCAQVSFGRVADAVLVDIDGIVLLPVAHAKTTPGVLPLDATLEWSSTTVARAAHMTGAFDLEAMQACCAASLIAGALMNLFQRTLRYANERQQFGRPIGKFQAIQHQLSVLAEHTFAARMAAQIGCESGTWMPDRMRTAVAKARTSEVALEGCAIAHSIHGAIGFTAEFDLQLYTRRLHAWRQTAGSESYWHDVLGEELIDHRSGPALDAIRATTDVHLNDKEGP